MGFSSLSIVIPAYDEADRIAHTLERIGVWRRQTERDVEVIVVDDGSRDATAALARRAGWVRVLQEGHRGKACAVRTGMLAASGDLVLFSDADLAVPIEEVTRLIDLQQSGYDVVIASREGSGARRIGEPWHRHAMGRAFNALVRLLVVPGIHDTQCGFKLFTREACFSIFSALRLYDESSPELAAAAVTAFDVEVLFLARLKGFRIAEAPVTWRFGEQSKVSCVRDSVYNFWDVIRVRWKASRGHYGSARG
jgi:glycosyltransferase involved in cell wall biosynthesis